MEYRQLSVRIDNRVYELLQGWHMKCRISKTVGVELALKDFIARHPNGVAKEMTENRT
jgi:hypothetical protein